MCNIPFYAAKSPYFKTMVKGIANFGPTYDPPSSKIIGGQLLMKKDIEAAIEPIRKGWSRNGCSLIGDGWSDVRRRPLQGLIVSSRGKSFFIKAYDSSGHQKTSENLVAIWGDGTDYVGASNVVQFISDSEASNKRAGMLLESRYPHLFWTPCVAHGLNNLMKDIGALPWIAPTIQKGRDVVTFIYRHHYSLALYRRLTNKELLKYVETRFAYNFLMLQRLFDMRHELRQLVV